LLPQPEIGFPLIPVDGGHHRANGFEHGGDNSHKKAAHFKPDSLRVTRRSISAKP
jgi:hypothetical protein